ncbi:MAG: hypothetical protein SFV53_05710 [Rickettsiales bacterium]|nr:hypothetical protein [Rickettsiales bacterium]
MLEFLFGLLVSLKKALPTLLLIFSAVFILIILIRLVLTFLLERAYKNLLKIKKKSEQFFPKSDKKYIKEDEELLRKKFSEIPRAHSEVKAELQAKKNQSSSGTYEIITSKQVEQERKELNEVNIVDIVKPVGFWTSMILGQKLTYLIQSAQILNKRGDKGFWASMIEAKERVAGRQHSRGR